MSVAYHIKDEPIGGPRGVPALDPFWPLLAMMFGGAWLGALVFAFNGWILRGPTWTREIGLAIATLIGAPVILFGLGALHSVGALPTAAFSYALLLVVAWKLGFAYWMYFLQQSSYALYQYFGGGANRAQAVPIGVLLVIVGSYLKPQIVQAVASPFWQVMVN